MNKFLLLIFSIGINTHLFAQAPDTMIYSIVAAGQVKGFDKEWKNPDGSYTGWYQYNDRGRGDSIITVFREDEHGYPTYIKASGKDYMKNNVTEEFSLINGLAKWKNNAEDEQRTINEKLFYIGLKTGGGHFIKAIKASGNKINLLPFGQAEIRLLQKHKIGSGSDMREITLIETKGFGLTPFLILYRIISH